MKHSKYSKTVLMLMLSMSFLLMKSVAAVPAFLPNKDSVPMSQPMVIDGVWKISSINKNIRFEAGRAYSVDDWLHLFVLHIQPDMVVIKNVKQTAPGIYVGDDLPLLAKFTATLQPDGRMKAKAGVAVYDLIPVELDNPELMDEEIQKLAGGGDHADQPVTPDNPDHSNCAQLVIDPETNQPVCLD